MINPKEVFTKVEKSKNKKYHVVVYVGGEIKERKIYYKKKQKRFHFHHDSNTYSFRFENYDTPVDLRWEGNYKELTGIYQHKAEYVEGKDVEVEVGEIKVEKAMGEKGEKKNIIDEIKKDIEKNKFEEKEVKHDKYETIKTCIKNNIPVFLYGPAGSGKNYTLQQIAEELEFDFYFTNSVQQEYKITGFIDAGGNYHETEFYKAFTQGGIFFLDEIDASIPEVLVLLNAAIANRYFEFPNGKVFAHKDFRVVAAGNTVGDGADEQYSGRLVLDQATLDRFVMIEFDYSYKVEINLAKGDSNLVSFIRDLRQQAKEKGIRATFSYRAIIIVTKLKDKLSLEEILKIAIFKGLDSDTINTFSVSDENEYYNALNSLKMAG
jgi:MoxR-like ATPase